MKMLISGDTHPIVGDVYFSSSLEDPARRLRFLIPRRRRAS
jgi:hypothetical protein